MKKHRRMLGAAAILTAAALFFPLRVLSVEDEHGTVPFLVPVAVGERYTVRFIHSVMRRPVDEIYEIGPASSILRETVYDMMGAGLPSAPEPGQTFTVEGNRFRISGFNLSIPLLTYRINKVVADHQMIFRGRTYPLKLWAAPGRPLTFRVRKVSAWRAAWHAAFRVLCRGNAA